MPDATIYVISDPPLPEKLELDFRISDDPEGIDAVLACMVRLGLLCLKFFMPFPCIDHLGSSSIYGRCPAL